MAFREAPTPTYDYDINRLTAYYEKALLKIQSQLNTLILSDFERAQILAVQKNIAAILKDLNVFTTEWTDEALTKAVTQGAASTIFSLGLVETMEEAVNLVNFNKLNKELIKAVVADTQENLLAVTQNIDKRTKVAIRKATAEVLRSRVTEGVNGTQTLRSDLAAQIRKQLGDSADTAILDSIGRRWKLMHYTDMLVRTKMMEAHIESTINEAVTRDVMYAVISRHGAKDACRNWEGKVIKLSPDAPGDYPYISDLPKREIFHNCCKHVISPVRRPDRLPEDLREINGI